MSAALNEMAIGVTPGPFFPHTNTKGKKQSGYETSSTIAESMERAIKLLNFTACNCRPSLFPTARCYLG